MSAFFITAFLSDMVTPMTMSEIRTIAELGKSSGQCFESAYGVNASPCLKTRCVTRMLRNKYDLMSTLLTKADIRLEEHRCLVQNLQFVETNPFLEFVG